jgi:integrase
MSTERVRYAQVRRNKNGTERHYWIRSGYPNVRLPDDRAKRIALVDRLNDQADRDKAKKGDTQSGEVDWLIQRYRDSDRYADLAPESRRVYERWLSRIHNMWGEMPVSWLTRRVVVMWVDSISGRASRGQAAAVLYNVLEQALRYGMTEINTAARLRISTPKPRDARWTPEDAQAFLSACDDPAVRLAFHLLFYTAQRPADVLRMRWSDYDGEKIRLRQQKTGTFLEVPCHRELQLILEKAKADRRGLTIVGNNKGQPISRDALTHRFKQLRRRCGLEHLQARDLRRTAILLMGEAGCTDAQIAAVSGHSIEGTRQILETYLPRTSKMASRAIRIWEESDA